MKDLRNLLTGRTPALLAHAAALALAVIGAGLLVNSRAHLSATLDESNHLVAGLEWWQHGSYTAWTENPPLARVAAAALPYWQGARLPERGRWDLRTNHTLAPWLTGAELLHAGDAYETNLRRLRQGMLVFFLLAVAGAWALAEGHRRPGAGLLAVGMTATLPPLIGHGALATTDVPFVAMLLLALLAARRWIEQPGPGRAAVLGAAAGAALLAKFSTVLFLPLALGWLFAARRLAGLPALPRDPQAGRATLAWQGALAAAAAALTVWAGYRFSIGAIDDLPDQARGWFTILPAPEQRGPLAAALLRLPLPAPELWHGLLFLRGHNQAGHTAFLLGEVSRSGFASFYLVALLVKTPLPFLGLVAVVLAPIARRVRAPETWFCVALAGAAASILIVSSFGRMNLGLRHVLPVLPLLAIATATGFAAIWQRARRARAWWAAAAAAALIGQAVLAARSHPNQLSYFNAAAGRDPAAVLLDSDLDWGQGLLQLRRELQTRGVTDLAIAYSGFTNPCRVGLPRLHSLVPGQPTSGWVAVSENYYRRRSYLMLRRDPCDFASTYSPNQVGPHPFAWLESKTPVAIVADSIRLYHLP